MVINPITGQPIAVGDVLPYPIQGPITIKSIIDPERFTPTAACQAVDRNGDPLVAILGHGWQMWLRGRQQLDLFPDVEALTERARSNATSALKR